MRLGRTGRLPARGGSAFSVDSAPLWPPPSSPKVEPPPPRWQSCGVGLGQGLGHLRLQNHNASEHGWRARAWLTHWLNCFLLRSASPPTLRSCGLASCTSAPANICLNLLFARGREGSPNFSTLPSGGCLPLLQSVSEAGSVLTSPLLREAG